MSLAKYEEKCWKCGTTAGEIHKECENSMCKTCGKRWHDCSEHDNPIRFTGYLPGVEECKQYNWYRVAVTYEQDPALSLEERTSVDLDIYANEVKQGRLLWSSDEERYFRNPNTIQDDAVISMVLKADEAGLERFAHGTPERRVSHAKIFVHMFISWIDNNPEFAQYLKERL